MPLNILYVSHYIIESFLSTYLNAIEHENTRLERNSSGLKETEEDCVVINLNVREEKEEVIEWTLNKDDENNQYYVKYRFRNCGSVYTIYVCLHVRLSCGWSSNFFLNFFKGKSSNGNL